MDLRDAELLSRIAAGTSATERRQAQAEFYERHVRYLYGAVLRQRRLLLEVAGEGPEDLVHETFQRAFERAHTFRDEPAHDADRARRRVRAWLGRIAQRLLADALARRQDVIGLTHDLPDPECEPEPSATPVEPHAMQLLREGLDRLSEREQDVLRVTALYQRVGADHQRLPNAVARELAVRWNVSTENVRAIRSRALRKLRAYVEQAQSLEVT